MVVGTIDYMAPEQIEGGPLDARVDVYSLGCVLFEALTGDVPYPRDRHAARMYAHVHTPPPRVSELAPGVSPEFDLIVARALAKNPSDRYPSAGDLGRAALAAAEGRPVSLPERSVASGAAAPSNGAARRDPATAQTEVGTTPTAAMPTVTGPTPPVGRRTANAPTLPALAPVPRHGAGDGPEHQDHERRKGTRLRTGAILLGLGAAAAAVLAIVIATSGGGRTVTTTVAGHPVVTSDSRVVRAAPNLNAAVVGPLGATVVIVCTINGSTVSGSTLWDRVAQPGGFVPDAVVNTPTHAPLASQCGRSPPATPTTTTSTTTAPAGSFQAHQFTVQLPPGNWVLEHQEQARTGYVDTRWHLAGSPNVVFLIDYTIGFSGTPVAAANSVRQSLVNASGYQELSFAPVILSYGQAQRWEYIDNGVHSIDTFINACNTSFAVRGGTPVADWSGQYSQAFDNAIASLKASC
jgi:Protein kinase domain